MATTDALQPWPVAQDYNEAIQNPATSFSDPELRGGVPTLNALGMPLPRSGNFADVYEFTCPATKSKWALKCFTRRVPGLRERYSEISRYLQTVRLPFTVEFQYLDQGIRIRGQWYPILKMRWVEGLLLNEFVRDYVDKPALLQQLSQIWARMGKRLREAQLAHCDLQHGNVVLVTRDQKSSLGVKLIDYDGMFVRALASRKSGEVGHPNYQHPQRLREGTYTDRVDRFPLLVVATALQALTVGGRGLWERYDNGDNLLFKETDLRAPRESALFKELLGMPDPATKALVECLLRSCARKLEETPPIEDVVAVVDTKAAGARGPAAPVPFAGMEAAAPKRRGRAARRGRMPAWLWGAGVAVAVMLAAGVFAYRGWRNGPANEPVGGGSPDPAAPRTGGLPGQRPASDGRETSGQAERRGQETRAEREETRAERDSAQARKELAEAKRKSEELAAAGKKAEESREEAIRRAVEEEKTRAREEEAKNEAARRQAKEEEAKKRLATMRPQLDPTLRANALGMTFVHLPKGTFYMGWDSDEKKSRKATIEEDFEIAIHTVTQGQWQAVMGNNPSSFSRMGKESDKVKDISDADLEQFPVEMVSWDDAQKFIEKLNERERGKGWTYRLPTEIEWEYACRGGATSEEECSYHFYFAKPTNDLSSEQANFNGSQPFGLAPKGKFLGRPATVGSYPPNKLGLYDMHGNVWQWCEDRFDARGALRVFRGGSWYDFARNCRAAYRNRYVPGLRDSNLGFRLARVPVR